MQNGFIKFFLFILQIVPETARDNAAINNETVHINEINYSTFAKTNRLSKGTVFNREYEITLMRNYIPAKIVDKPFSINNTFYDGKEFENTLRLNKN